MAIIYGNIRMLIFNVWFGISAENLYGHELKLGIPPTILKSSYTIFSLDWLGTPPLGQFVFWLMTRPPRRNP